jgi:hypothetical protein
MLLMGFGSKARQGKDTAAEAVRDYYEHDFNPGYMHKPPTVGVFKFATALYREVNDAIKEAGSIEALLSRGYIKADTWDGDISTMFSQGISFVTIPDWVQIESNPEISELSPYGKHPKLLQWWGTDFRRSFDPNYWVKKTMSGIPTNLDIALISDVRFPNEAQAVKSWGGHTVNVQRLREDGSQYFSTDRPVDHSSETALDGYNWDFRLINSAGHGALLGEQAVTLAEYLRGLGK